MTARGTQNKTQSREDLHMSRTAFSGSLYWAVLSLPFTCFAQVADTVTDYAGACYAEIGVAATS